jgi:SAM-dependent methyltransferase
MGHYQVTAADDKGNCSFMAWKDQPLKENHQENLKQQYQLRFAELQLYREKVWQVLCRDFFSQFVPPESTILDLGTGWGEFINHIAAARKYAMDLNPATPEHLAPGITFIHQDCSTTWPLESASLDVVFSSNFLEHLFDKASVERAVAEAYRTLKDGGIFICMSPNMNCIPGAYWNFWDHHVPLTEQSCAELFRLKGFSITHCIPRFLPYSMSGVRKSPLIFIRLFLRLPLIWPLFGKQFLVIGRKCSNADRERQ